MRFSEYKALLYSDLYRVSGSANLRILFRRLLSMDSYKYNFWMRTCSYAESGAFLRIALYPIARVMLRRLTFKLGISIPHKTNIGKDFYIGHFGGIVVNERATIGKNCNISHGVTIGQANRGKYAGYPIVGDDVYIGPGAVITGAVKVGNRVAVGANCVVTKDVPDDSVVVGMPARVISKEGSAGYVSRTDYEGKI